MYTMTTVRRSVFLLLLSFWVLFLNVASAFLHHQLLAPLRQQKQQQQQQPTQTPQSCPLLMTAEQPNKQHVHVRQQHHHEQHSRNDALFKLGGVVLGPGLMMAGTGGGASAAATPSSRKSIKEIQFEMMKEGLDLTHAFKFEEAEQVYTDLIALFGPSPGEHEKQVLAK